MEAVDVERIVIGVNGTRVYYKDGPMVVLRPNEITVEVEVPLDELLAKAGHK